METPKATFQRTDNGTIILVQVPKMYLDAKYDLKGLKQEFISGCYQWV